MLWVRNCDWFCGKPFGVLQAVLCTTGVLGWKRDFVRRQGLSAGFSYAHYAFNLAIVHMIAAICPPFVPCKYGMLSPLSAQPYHLPPSIPLATHRLS